MLDITLLGTSALVPLPDRAETSVFLKYKGHSILFDCGEGTQTAARRAGVSLMRVDVIALTHYHGDHIFGLPGLLQTMSMMNRTQPLTIIAPEGIERELAPILYLTGGTNYEIRLREIGYEPFCLSALEQGWPEEATLTAVPTEHRVISQGYCFEVSRAGKFLPEKAKALGLPPVYWGCLQRGETVFYEGHEYLPSQVLGAPRRGLKFVFSGDTKPCESLKAAARDADLFICEATYGDNEQAQLAADHGHTNFEQAGKLAAEAGVRRLWLTHYSQMIEDPAACLPNAQAFYPAAECGYDGMNIRLLFDET